VVPLSWWSLGLMVSPDLCSIGKVTPVDRNSLDNGTRVNPLRMVSCKKAMLLVVLGNLNPWPRFLFQSHQSPVCGLCSEMTRVHESVRRESSADGGNFAIG
jgi:hypothetical protein